MKTSTLIFSTAFTIFCVNSFAKTIRVFETSTEPELAVEFKRDIVPQKYSNIKINLQELATQLQNAPIEFSDNASNEKYYLELPNPDGGIEVFNIQYSSIMEDGLAKQFPNIKTYSGQGITDPSQTIRFDITDFGFHAMVLSSNGTWFIDPYSKQNTINYISYFKKDYVNTEKMNFSELPPIDLNEKKLTSKSNIAANCIGDKLRTYRLAVACTGEYSVAIAGVNATTSLILSAITTSVNRVTGIYQTELAIKLVLVANETSIIFLSPSSDPFNGNNNSNTLINESQNVISSNIGYNNFDIGHTFSTGGGGLANLGCVCDNGTKASGITGSPNPVGDAYDVDYVAHEMGHQFGGNHTFNSGLGSCQGNINSSTAFEVGSGTTIMAYAGICSNDNTQSHSDPFFHTGSFDEIVIYSNSGGGNSCPVKTNTSNNIPVIVMPPSGKIIPKKTPFVLQGSATDVDGDALTYCWEEFDAGQSTTWNGGVNTNDAPIFKSRVPSTSTKRYFPSLAVIKANYPTNPSATLVGANNLKGEMLPISSRLLNFRLTVRDNKVSGGGIATGGFGGCSVADDFVVEVDDASGPFKVLIPNGAEAWEGATYENFTWDVSGTNVGLVNTPFVDILYSIDGGNSFEDTVVSNVPNTGSYLGLVPNIPTNISVRFMIKGHDNYFFDISDANFKITFNANPSAIKDVSKQSLNVAIAPNPAHNSLQVNISNANFRNNCTYQITDNMGKLVKVGNVSSSLNNIDINTLSNGLFFIRLINDNKIYINKFIKQ